jgi:AsmA protein
LAPSSGGCVWRSGANVISANLYQGTIQATAQLDATKVPATYSAKKSVKGVQVLPLLKDVLNNEMLQGTGNIDVDVKGRSLTPTGIQQNLVGTVNINFADGAVNGINVAHLIRSNYAKIKGNKVDDDPVKKTDFSAMTATLKLNKGEVTTNNLAMQSPLLRIRGEGKANYLQQTVDFLVSTSVVGTLEGQGGKDIDELRDVTIPINISGQWSDPKFKLVFDDVLRQKAEKEIDRGLEKLGVEIKDEKTKKAVDGLLKSLFKINYFELFLFNYCLQILFYFLVIVDFGLSIKLVIYVCIFFIFYFVFNLVNNIIICYICF